MGGTGVLGHTTSRSRQRVETAVCVTLQGQDKGSALPFVFLRGILVKREIHCTYSDQDEMATMTFPSTMKPISTFTGKRKCVALTKHF